MQPKKKQPPPTKEEVEQAIKEIIAEKEKRIDYLEYWKRHLYPLTPSAQLQEVSRKRSLNPLPNLAAFQNRNIKTTSVKVEYSRKEKRENNPDTKEIKALWRV